MIEWEVESCYIEVKAKNGSKFIIGSLYRASNTSKMPLINHLGELIPKLSQECRNNEIILGIDHNLDLIKSHLYALTQRFLDETLELGLWPNITQPSRIMQRSATLIDNIFISPKFQQSYNSALLLADILDHLPLLILVKQSKPRNKELITFQSRGLTEGKMSQIKYKLSQHD